MNFEPLPPPDTDNYGSQMLTVGWTFTSLAIIVVTLKLWTRLRVLHLQGYDDALVAISGVLSIIHTSLLTVAIHYGLGQHAFFLSFHQRATALKYVVIAHPFGAVTSALPNVAVAIALGNLLFLEGWKRCLLYGIPLLQCLLTVASILMGYFSARPLKGLWDPNVPSHLVPISVVDNVWFANAGISALTGFYLGLLPVFALWTMKLALSKKIGVIILMGGTVLGGIAAAYRATKLKRNGLDNDFMCELDRVKD